jgi:hypothetical protein
MDNRTLRRTVSKSTRDLERVNIWTSSRSATPVRCQHDGLWLPYAPDRTYSPLGPGTIPTS